MTRKELGMFISRLWRIPREDWFYKYGLAVLLLVVPLYPKFPIFNFPGTYVAVRAEDFIIGILGLFWFMGLLQDGISSFLKSKLNLAILLFVLSGALSLASALLLTHTVAVQVAMLHWLRRIEYIIPLFIAYKAVKSGGSIKYYVQILAIVVFLVFLFGLGQRYFQFPIISTQNEEYSKGVALRWISGARLPSTFAGHYDLAAFLVLAFPILIASFTLLKKTSHKLVLVLFILIPAYWLFLQTESRVSFVSYLFAVSLTLFLLKRTKYVIPFFILSVVGMILFSGLGTRYVKTLEIYKQKLIGSVNFSFPAPVMAFDDSSKMLAYEQLQYQEPTVVPEDRSVAIRTNVEWPRAVRSFLKNPLLGTGYSSLSLATDNDYLRMLGEVGIVGTLAFFLVIMRLIEGFGSFLRQPQKLEVVFISGFLGALVGLFTTATFIDAFEASKIAIIFWALAGLAYGVVNKESAEV